MPRFIDVKSWNKHAKNDRISTVAAQAKTGHWYYLTTIPEIYLRVLRTTVNEHPASVKRDTLDMLGQAHADEVLRQWIPVAVPVIEKKVEYEPVMYSTRYTGLPVVFH